MCAIGRCAVFALFFTGFTRAEDAPAIHQSAPNFSNAIAGAGFAVSWSADPTTLDDQDSIHLAITFLGATNPERIRRPMLRDKSAFKGAFREIVDEEPTNAPNAITFHYRLRPRDAAVKEVPELAIAYYAPGNATVATKYLDAIPLVVRPADAMPAPNRPLEAPERFFSWPETESGVQPGLSAWGLLALGLVISSLVGLAVERRRNPDGVRLARLRRVRAVRTALDALDRAARSPDPAGAALEALRLYLASRHGAVAAAATPGDFDRALASTSIIDKRIDAVRAIAMAGDAERFAPERSTADLVPRVRGLILDWEESA
jgi:hypothetical protein